MNPGCDDQKRMDRHMGIGHIMILVIITQYSQSQSSTNVPDETHTHAGLPATSAFWFQLHKNRNGCSMTTGSIIGTEGCIPSVTSAPKKSGRACIPDKMFLQSIDTVLIDGNTSAGYFLCVHIYWIR